VKTHSDEIRLIKPIVVREDTPVSECLESMRTEGTSVAVAIDDSGRYVGIFTENDYFAKGQMIEWLLNRDRKPPIKAWIDRSVRPIPASTLHSSPGQLLSTGRRYFPIASQASSNSSNAEIDGELYELAGIASLDEILRFHLRNNDERKAVLPDLQKTRLIHVGILSDEPSLLCEGSQYPSKLDDTNLLSVRPIEGREIASDWQVALLGMSLNGLVIDITTVESDQWVKFLCRWLRLPFPPPVLIFTPEDEYSGLPEELAYKLERHSLIQLQPRPDSQESASNIIQEFTKSINSKAMRHDLKI
jgi:hypothetical protein